jgi:hypothetical protein
MLVCSRSCSTCRCSALAFGLSNLVVYELEGALAVQRLPLLPPRARVSALIADRRRLRAGHRAAGAARSRRAVALYAAALLPGLSNLGLVDWSFSNPGLGSKYDGYDLSKLAATLLAPKNRPLAGEITRYLESFPGPLRARVARGASASTSASAQVLREGHGLDAVLPTAASISTRSSPRTVGDREELARGAGIGARFLKDVRSAPRRADLLALLERSRCGVQRGRAPAPLRVRRGRGDDEPDLPLASAVRGRARRDRRLDVTRTTRGTRDVASGASRAEGILCGAPPPPRDPERSPQCGRRARERPARARAGLLGATRRADARRADEPGLPAGSRSPRRRARGSGAAFAATCAIDHGAEADGSSRGSRARGGGPRVGSDRPSRNRVAPSRARDRPPLAALLVPGARPRSCSPAIACRSLRPIAVRPVPAEATQLFVEAEALDAFGRAGRSAAATRARARELAEAARAAAPDWLAPRPPDSTTSCAPSSAASRRSRPTGEALAGGPDAGELYLAGRLEGVDGEARFAARPTSIPTSPGPATASRCPRSAARTGGRRSPRRGPPRARARSLGASFFASSLARILARSGTQGRRVSVLGHRLDDEDVVPDDARALGAQLAVIALEEQERGFAARGVPARDRSPPRRGPRRPGGRLPRRGPAHGRRPRGERPRRALERARDEAHAARDRLRAEVLLTSSSTPLALGLLERSLGEKGPSRSRRP